MRLKGRLFPWCALRSSTGMSSFLVELAGECGSSAVDSGISAPYLQALPLLAEEGDTISKAHKYANVPAPSPWRWFGNSFSSDHQMVFLYLTRHHTEK